MEIKRHGAFWKSEDGQLFAWDDRQGKFLSVSTGEAFEAERTGEDTAIIRGA